MIVNELNDRDDLDFISDSQSVELVKDLLGPKARDYDSFFISYSDGDFSEVYGMEGNVPYLWKTVVRLL